jgi:hypothetical protein
MSGDQGTETDIGVNTVQNRRRVLRLGGAALASGLAGCSKYVLSDEEDGDGVAGTPHPESDEATEYYCDPTTYVANIVPRKDVGNNWKDEGGREYIARLAKECAEHGLAQTVPQTDQYDDFEVIIDPDPYWSDHSRNSFALFEAPYFDGDMTEKYEGTGVEAPNANILLRKGGGGSMLGLAVTDFSADLCDTTTQACIMNYANLLGHYDQREDTSMDDEWIPLVQDNEPVDDLLVNAIVTTLTHEGSPGHLGYMAHSDGIAKRWEEDTLADEGIEDAENSRWWSSIMSSFYGLAAGAYGLANSCGRDFQAPEYTGGGFGGVTWLDDLYFRNDFSRCADGKFVDAADLDDLDRREPRFEKGPDDQAPPENADLSGTPGETAADAVAVWRRHPAVQAAEERHGETLDDAWSDVADAHLHAVNIEGLTPWAEAAESPEQQEAIAAFRDLFGTQIADEAGTYVGHDAADTVDP